MSTAYLATLPLLGGYKTLGTYVDLLSITALFA